MVPAFGVLCPWWLMLQFLAVWRSLRQWTTESSDECWLLLSALTLGDFSAHASHGYSTLEWKLNPFITQYKRGSIWCNVAWGSAISGTDDSGMCLFQRLPRLCIRVYHDKYIICLNPCISYHSMVSKHTARRNGEQKKLRSPPQGIIMIQNLGESFCSHSHSR